ncbi:MAG TPA: Gfo/Idh/MocA family oxidoreductase [Steroidobacteraceae bacterium]|nr:Gfo/Idh/MocA family oxidoreductase [Steroidobacteraceae bacterium]
MKLPRRQFVRNAALATAAFTIVPRHVLGGPRHIAPSDRVNIAGVGVGGMGRANMQALSGMNLVAMCDVDWSYVDARYADIPKQLEAANKRLAEATDEKIKAQAQAQIKGWQQLQEKWPKTRRYTDYREMLAKQKNIDAVVIATPDHTHAHIALAAMDLGKHVYVQKPLAWSVEECRRLAAKASSSKLQTQMGNQGHSSDDARLVNEYMQSGAIGTVTEVHVWTNRPLAYWPQGIPRPAPLPANAKDLPWNMNGVMTRAAGSFGAYTPPDKLAWDLFLGPSRHIEYHPIYHPFNWRGWTDWGVGAIGDMGAHLIDSSFWSLDLDYPTTIETTSTPYNKDTYPMASTTYYEFPAKGARPAVKMTWYDGGLTPPKPVEMGDEELNKGGGVLYIGTKGKLLHDTYGFNPRLLPKSLHESVGKPKETYARITTSHEMNWIDAIRGTQKTTSPFEYSGKLTEIMLLGVAALNAGRKIEYDGANMKVTNVPDSDALLRRQYRSGWPLPA